MLDVGREENAGDVVLVGREMGDGDKGCLLSILEKVPNVHVTLWMSAKPSSSGSQSPTEFVPAQRVEPSLATVTLATGTSSSGIN